MTRYTNAPFVSMELNGKEVVPKSPTPPFMNAEYMIAYAPGNLTAVARGDAGEVLGSFTRLTPVPGVAALKLSIDAPSPLTGTGSALVADGEDTAMVRATLLDANGGLAVEAMDEVVFRVAAGDGRLWATHSGNPAPDMNKNPAHGGTRHAYHGLARAYIRSSSDHATAPRHRRRLRQIDVDGGRLTAIADPGAEGEGEGKGAGTPLLILDGIVVTATLKACAGHAGCPSDTITIPLTADLAQLPLAVAERPAEANAIAQ